MKIKTAPIIVAVLFLFLFFSGIQNVYAIPKFNTKFQIYYKVNPNGTTHVNYVVDQRNNLSIVYATDFSLSVNETRIDNVKVTDEGVGVIPDVVKSINQTTISFSFANKIVGKDKSHLFTIEYDTADIATQFGNTWQINIPRLESDENVSEQSVVLTVPPNFPAPAYIDPKPDIVNKNVYYFSGTRMANKPVSAVFGKTQYYQGKLIYHLTNDQKERVRTEIALPPDTSYQTVWIEKMDPEPESVYRDEDGNILAKYILGPLENKDVAVNFSLKLDFLPKPTLIQPSESYILSNSIWNYDNNVFTIPELKNLVTPKTIFDYVVDKLKYDYEKLNRQRSLIVPAAESMINGQSAICTDFTNVFVALSRKAGIPTREIQGFAISENPDLKPLSLDQDVLHAWPEYFDKTKNTWIQVDPTWSNTTRGIDYFNKLDFNHIAFVIHGTKPDYPIPAGGYKQIGVKGKDITIDPITEKQFPTPSFKIQFIKQEGKEIIFNISNSQGVSFTGNTIVSGDEYLEETERVINIAPFSSTEYRIRIKKAPYIGIKTIKVIIYINGERYEQSATITPSITQIGILAGIGGFLAIVAIASWSLYLRKRKPQTPLYR